MIGEEIERHQNKIQTWVQHRLEDSASLLSVPGLIAGDKKSTKCQFETFTDFAKTILKEVNKKEAFE